MNRFRNRINRFCFAFLCSLVSAGILVAVPANAVTRDPGEYFFNQSFGDLTEELQVARDTGKKAVLIMFDNAECPWCQKMKSTILNQVEVQDYYRKHFQVIRVDTEGGNPLVDFDGKEWKERDWTLKVNRVRATPVFLFFDLRGNEIVRYTGAVRNVEEFMWLGEFVASKLYLNQRFAKYKRERKAKAGKQAERE